MTTKPARVRKPRKLPEVAPLATEPPPMGDNNPPEETPLLRLTKLVDDGYEEAKNWLDGDPIKTDGQAEAVDTLKGMLKDLGDEISEARDAETKPLHKAWKDAIAKWKPLEERIDKAKRTAANALLPWLEAKEAENRRLAKEAADRAAEAAERLRLQAEKDRQTDILSDEQDLERARAEQDAKDAAREAAMAKKAPATVGGGRTRLRTVWLVAVKDRKELLRHYMLTDPDWLGTVLRERAEKDVHGGARNLPGCSIWDERRAV